MGIERVGEKIIAIIGGGRELKEEEEKGPLTA